MLKARFLLASAAVAMTVSPATAATFTAEHGVSTTGCNSASSTGAFATGQVITYNSSGCKGGYSVFLDTAAQTITFTTAQAPFADYRFSEFTITGITETVINSLSVVQLAPLFNTANRPAPTTALSFTGSSINILFGTRSGSTPVFDFSTNGGQAIFSYNSTAVVPEPGTWAMMILGFGAVGGAMRRRSATAKASRMRLTYA